MKRLLSTIPSLGSSTWNGFVVPDSNIRLKILGEDLRDESIAVFSNMFCNYKTEPMFGGTSCTNVTGPGSMTEFFNIYYDAILEENLSLVSIDGDQNDKVVGCILNEDFGYVLDPPTGEVEFPEGVDEFLERSPQIWDITYDILDVLEHHYSEHCKRNGYDKVIHFFFGAVDESVHGKRVLYHLTEQSGVLGKELGYQSMFAECTNIFSHQIFPLLGDLSKNETGFEHNCLLILPYDGWTYKDGTRPYAGLNELAIAELKEKGNYDEKYADCSTYLYLDELVF